MRELVNGQTIHAYQNTESVCLRIYMHVFVVWKEIVNNLSLSLTLFEIKTQIKASTLRNMY